MDGTKLNNPLDPLGQAEDAALELFKEFGRVSNHHPVDSVIVAAANILVNALRQTKSNRREAEAAYDELMGRLKGVLLEHYDSVNGGRRGIFPHAQVIRPDFFKSKNGF